MKCTAALTVLAAAGAMAAPSTSGFRKIARQANSTTTTDTTAYSYSHPQGIIFPRVIKNHDVNTNDNVFDVETNTVRNGGTELTTLYELPIPAEAAGKTCATIIKAGRIGYGDDVRGEQALDIFTTQITDLSAQYTGNLRNAPLARLRFNSYTGIYEFDPVDVVPRIQEFPCPAGKTLEWESVSVGEFDVNVITQDTSYDYTNIPNGLTIAFY